jgi:hypothetical protein
MEVVKGAKKGNTTAAYDIISILVPCFFAGSLRLMRVPLTQPLGNNFGCLTDVQVESWSGVRTPLVKALLRLATSVTDPLTSLATLAAGTFHTTAAALRSPHSSPLSQSSTNSSSGSSQAHQQPHGNDAGARAAQQAADRSLGEQQAVWVTAPALHQDVLRAEAALECVGLLALFLMKVQEASAGTQAVPTLTVQHGTAPSASHASPDVTAAVPRCLEACMSALVSLLKAFVSKAPMAAGSSTTISSTSSGSGSPDVAAMCEDLRCRLLVAVKLAASTLHALVTSSCVDIRSMCAAAAVSAHLTPQAVLDAVAAECAAAAQQGQVLVKAGR